MHWKSTMEKEKLAENKELNNWNNIIIPILAVFFIGIYWSVGLLMYYSPALFDSFDSTNFEQL